MQVNLLFGRRPAAALLLAALAGSLGACKTVESVGRELTEATYESVPGKFVDVADERRLQERPSRDMKALGLADGEAPPDWALLENSAVLEGYVAEIVDRLLKGWPHEVPHLAAHVTTADEYAAEVLPNGAVRIPQGLFLNAESEDELAYVLAHEISHRLLNHHAKEEEERDVHSVMGSALALSAAATGSSSQDRPNALSAAILATMAVERMVLAPSWSRLQEDEADLLAVDLLLKADYSYAAPAVVFQRLDAQQRKQAEEEQQVRDAYDAQVSTMLGSRQMSEGINMATQRLAQAPGVIFGKLLHALTADHHDPRQREREINAYIEREYEDAPLLAPKKDVYEVRVFSGEALKALSKPILTKRAESLLKAGQLAEAAELAEEALDDPRDTDVDLRILLYRIRVEQGQPDRAIKNLQIAARDQAAGASVFELWAAAAVELGRYDEALTALTALVRKFPDRRVDLLPVRLSYALTAGKSSEAQTLFQECQDSKNASVLRSCVAVQTDWQLRTSRPPAAESGTDT